MFSMNLFIFGNPMSGSQSGQQQINQIVEACTKHSIHFKLFQTQRAGELNYLRSICLKEMSTLKSSLLVETELLTKRYNI